MKVKEVSGKTQLAMHSGGMGHLLLENTLLSRRVREKGKKLQYFRLCFAKAAKAGVAEGTIMSVFCTVESKPGLVNLPLLS